MVMEHKAHYGLSYSHVCKNTEVWVSASVTNWRERSRLQVVKQYCFVSTFSFRKSHCVTLSISSRWWEGSRVVRIYSLHIYTTNETFCWIIVFIEIRKWPPDLVNPTHFQFVRYPRRCQSIWTKNDVILNNFAQLSKRDIRHRASRSKHSGRIRHLKSLSFTRWTADDFLCQYSRIHAWCVAMRWSRGYFFMTNISSTGVITTATAVLTGWRKLLRALEAPLLQKVMASSTAVTINQILFTYSLWAWEYSTLSM